MKVSKTFPKGTDTDLVNEFIFYYLENISHYEHFVDYLDKEITITIETTDKEEKK